LVTGVCIPAGQSFFKREPVIATHLMNPRCTLVSYMGCLALATANGAIVVIVVH
jgi:hypothetical protein